MPLRFVLAMLLLAAFSKARAAEAPPTFNDQVLPIFREKCCGCHNPDKKKGGLDLTSHGQTMAGGSSGEVIAAGDADGSYLWQLASHASEPKMPPESDKIPAEMLDVIKRWIAGGAIERAGGSPVARKTTAIALDPAAGVAPEGPLVMPPRLSLEVIAEAARPTTITALAVSPHGEVAAVGGRRQLLLHHTASLELLGVLPFPEGVVKTVRFTRNGKLLLAGGGEAAKSGRVVIWDVAKGARIAELGDEYDEVLAADLSADQRLVALGGQARVVRLLTTADGEVESELRKHTDWVTAIEFSPQSSRQGELLATGDRAGNLFLWEPRGGREHGTLKGHTAAITAMAWRPDGSVLATVSEDGSLRLWNPKESTQLKTWQAHVGGGRRAAGAGDSSARRHRHAGRRDSGWFSNLRGRLERRGDGVHHRRCLAGRYARHQSASLGQATATRRKSARRSCCGRAVSRGEGQGRRRRHAGRGIAGGCCPQGSRRGRGAGRRGENSAGRDGPACGTLAGRTRIFANSGCPGEIAKQRPAFAFATAAPSLLIRRRPLPMIPPPRESRDRGAAPWSDSEIIHRTSASPQVGLLNGCAWW